MGKDESVNFVGVGRNVALSAAAHLANEGEDMVHFIKVKFKFRCIDRFNGSELMCVADRPHFFWVVVFDILIIDFVYS